MIKLTGQQVADEELQGWVNLCGFLKTRIRTPDFATGLSVVDLIGAAIADLDRPPELDRVTITSTFASRTPAVSA